MRNSSKQLAAWRKKFESVKNYRYDSGSLMQVGLKSAWPIKQVMKTRSKSYSVDLIRQMAECDANYIRLLKLVPLLRELRRDPQGIAGYQSAGNLAEFVIADDRDGRGETVVEVRIIECFKYTTTLEITQRPAAGGWLTNPTMQVRIYHDASTAEVTSYQNHRNFQPHYVQPNPAMYQRDEKIQVNRFLGEWLTLCLQAGRCLKVPDIAFS